VNPARAFPARKNAATKDIAKNPNRETFLIYDSLSIVTYVTSTT
jgi:hypothetical protein